MPNRASVRHWSAEPRPSSEAFYEAKVNDKTRIEVKSEIADRAKASIRALAVHSEVNKTLEIKLSRTSKTGRKTEIDQKSDFSSFTDFSPMSEGTLLIAYAEEFGAITYVIGSLLYVIGDSAACLTFLHLSRTAVCTEKVHCLSPS